MQKKTKVTLIASALLMLNACASNNYAKLAPKQANLCQPLASDLPPFYFKDSRLLSHSDIEDHRFRAWCLNRVVELKVLSECVKEDY